MLLSQNAQFLPNHYETQSKLVAHEYLILIKFCNDRVKIVDFLIKAYFWFTVRFFAPHLRWLQFRWLNWNSLKGDQCKAAPIPIVYFHSSYSFKKIRNLPLECFQYIARKLPQNNIRCIPEKEKSREYMNLLFTLW